MAEFYQRHIGPEFVSSSTGVQAQLLGNLANRLEQFRGEREREKEALLQEQKRAGEKRLKEQERAAEKRLKEQERAAEKRLKEQERAAEKLRDEQERDAEALRMAQFQNIAKRAAIEAYQANPDDTDAYSSQFREFMRKVPTPIAQQGRYGAIVESTEAQYFWTIASNQGKVQHGELKDSAKDAANDLIRSGIRIQSGELSSPASARRGQLRFAQGA